MSFKKESREELKLLKDKNSNLMLKENKVVETSNRYNNNQDREEQNNNQNKKN